MSVSAMVMPSGVYATWMPCGSSHRPIQPFGAKMVVSAMPEVMEFYRMAGDVDYMLRVVVADIAGYDTFYKKLIASVPLKNVTSRFAMERIKSTTALPITAAPAERG